MGVAILILWLVDLDFFHEVLTILEHFPFKKSDETPFKLLIVLTLVRIFSDEKRIVADS